ncbi:MAG: DUF4242 domain-containing protein [Desulfobacterales bacterium]|nr:DUF4242 domain-containing protein [Desulfobacterales bacterium]
MTKFNKYIAVHHNPGIDCKVVQANWRELAKVESAKWIRTYFDEDSGRRFCIWLAPDEAEVKKIFDEIGVSYEYILPVEETSPDLWGEKWQEHLQKDAVADNLGN